RGGGSSAISCSGFSARGGALISTTGCTRRVTLISTPATLRGRNSGGRIGGSISIEHLRHQVSTGVGAGVNCSRAPRLPPERRPAQPRQAANETAAKYKALVRERYGACGVPHRASSAPSEDDGDVLSEHLLDMLPEIARMERGLRAAAYR